MLKLALEQKGCTSGSMASSCLEKKTHQRQTVLDDSQESGVCKCVWLDLANLPDHLTQHLPVHDPLETCHDAVEYQSQLSDLRFHLDNLPSKPLLLSHHPYLCKAILLFFSSTLNQKNLETKIVKL
jgi:hypothetical protein